MRFAEAHHILEHEAGRHGRTRPALDSAPRPHGVNGAAVATDPVESAVEAGLRYVTDQRPGIRRHRSGKGFRYVRPDGTVVRDEPTLGASPRW